MKILTKNILYGKKRLKYYKQMFKIYRSNPNIYFFKYEDTGRYYADLVLYERGAMNRRIFILRSIRKDLHFLSKPLLTAV